MSLISALNIGKSALAVHQAAIQVTSNNVANAGNADYTRQTPNITPAPDQPSGLGLLAGGGIQLAAIERQIDAALEGRLRNSISDNASAQAQQQWLGRVESVLHELGDASLSNQLGVFFNSWSKLANQPQDMGQRQIVLQNGEGVAGTFRRLGTEMDGLLTDLDKRVSDLGEQADSLAGQVADLNGQIMQAEANGSVANGLRDQRDGVLKKLSTLININVQETSNGMVNVLVGSTPLVLGDTNQGLTVKQDLNGQAAIQKIVIKSDGGTLSVTSGQLGALLSARTEIQGVADQLNTVAGGLVFELNKLHSSGQGLAGFSSVTAENSVGDASAALNSPAAGLPFVPANGSLVVHVKQKSTGLVSSTLVQVSLTGQAGDTSLESLRASLDAIDGISATINGGKLKISADSAGVEFGFSQDSSGALAALGIGSFFSGSNATDMAVSAELKNNPSLLAASRNGQVGDNQTALAIADLQSVPLASLGNSTLNDSYQSIVNGIAVATSSAKTNAEAAQAVQDTLTAQREALSGVSLDEEAVNLMREQRAFQGAARVIAAVDELMKSLLQLV